MSYEADIIAALILIGSILSQHLMHFNWFNLSTLVLLNYYMKNVMTLVMVVMIATNIIKCIDNYKFSASVIIKFAPNPIAELP